MDGPSLLATTGPISPLTDLALPPGLTTAALALLAVYLTIAALRLSLAWRRHELIAPRGAARSHEGPPESRLTVRAALLWFGALPARRTVLLRSIDGLEATAEGAPGGAVSLEVKDRTSVLERRAIERELGDPIGRDALIRGLEAHFAGRPGVVIFTFETETGIA